MGGELQVKNYSGWFQMNNGGDFAWRTTVVSFRWRTPAVMDFKWKTLVVGDE